MTKDWGINLYLGCEYHANMDMVEELNAGMHPTLGSSHYVLCEFSDGDRAAYITERTYHLLANGYIPVLAHIERYKALTKDFSLIDDLVGAGLPYAGKRRKYSGGRWIFCRSLL